MMLVPCADNLNHHCVDNQFELFNSKLGKHTPDDDKSPLDNFEKQYFTPTKQKINFFKHFAEDDQGHQSIAASARIPAGTS